MIHANAHRFGALVLVGMLTIGLVASTVVPVVSQTSGAWTPPVVLSTGGQGWEAAAAIDGNGNSVALWGELTSQYQIWSRSKPSAGNWGSETQVSPALQTTSVHPAVRISTAGFATAVWTDANGVWTADRPTASIWNPPQLLIPGASNPIFVMDSQGDAAVVWTVGRPPGPSSSVMAVLRHAGGAWTSQQTIASGAYVSADHAGIGANGAVIVTWETYHAVCRRYCVLSNFVLHASRQNAGTGTWVDSGPMARRMTREWRWIPPGGDAGRGECFGCLHFHHAGYLRRRLEPVQNSCGSSGQIDYYRCSE